MVMYSAIYLREASPSVASATIPQHRVEWYDILYYIIIFSSTWLTWRHWCNQRHKEYTRRRLAIHTANNLPNSMHKSMEFFSRRRRRRHRLAMNIFRWCGTIDASLLLCFHFYINAQTEYPLAFIAISYCLHEETLAHKQSKCMHRFRCVRRGRYTIKK